MIAWIVVESMFGNTREVAEVVAEELRPDLDVEVLDVSAAPREVPADVAVLLVGGPTHALGMSRPNTREEARKRGADGPAETGIREWLTSARVRTGLPAAAFDTHADVRFVPGSAAKSASKRLRRLGCTLLARPHSFYVEDTAGPLAAGAQEDARRYAGDVMAALRRLGAPRASA